MTEIHQQRQVAEGFGADAERYDRTRPSYPDEMVTRIVAESPGHDVLDVGCGTGISARAFQRAGCRVLGVDVDERMAAAARRSGVECEVAGFEDWAAAGRTFDILIAGQAWHWIDPERGARKAREVLRPGGRLALFWNAFEPPAEIRRGFAAVQDRLAPDLPNAWRGDRSIADGYALMVERAGQTLGPLEQWRFEWDVAYTRAQWLDVLGTYGGVAGHVTPELQEAIGAVVGDGFTMHYTTVVGTTTRAHLD